MEVKVDVCKETYELGLGVAKMVAHVKEQLKDGWQPIGDSVVLAKDLFEDLVPAFEGVELIKDEVKDPAKLAETAAIIGAAILNALTK